MNRHCVCGKQITITSRLCNECLEKYGTDPDKWDCWIKYLVSDEQKEINRERRHKELFVDDEKLPISDLAEHNLARAKKYPEMDFDDFQFFNQ